MPSISAEEVESIFSTTLATDKEVGDAEAVEIEGVVNTYFFNKARLDAHKERIFEVLRNLPDEFKKSHGGGYSFLRAPMDKDGDQWGEQLSAERLLCMGIGLGLVSCPLPRSYWPLLPGGVPYYTINM